MTPLQKIKWMILVCLEKDMAEEGIPLPADVTPGVIDEYYDKIVDLGMHWDVKSEVRGGEVETSLKCEWSRHYESKAVAAKAPDGSWVGWTYWYGGGKHGEPEAIDWMAGAYDLTCVEEEKLVVVRQFTKIEPLPKSE